MNESGDNDGATEAGDNDAATEAGDNDGATEAGDTDGTPGPGTPVNGDTERALAPGTPSSSDRIAHRTAQLPLSSRLLYRIDHYTSMPKVVLAIATVVVALIAVGAGLGFPTGWLGAFEVLASAITLVMVFTIQHTQEREQAATQRKLDELLRALPGAADDLMMLEEAPKEFILEVEESQRDIRSEAVTPDRRART